jgi:hypothetical protein
MPDALCPFGWHNREPGVPPVEFPVLLSDSVSRRFDQVNEFAPATWIDYLQWLNLELLCDQAHAKACADEIG